MDRKIWIILASIAVCLLIVFIVLVIVLPIQRNKDAEDDVKDHSTPKNDNTLLWANFPGELKTQTFHTFNILGYSDDRSTASIKDSIKLSEETKYSNFEFSDLIKFDANSTFKIVSDKASKKNEKIKTLSLGLFETLQTLSNSEKYQQGISSIEYLIRKAFQSPQTFIKHLYSYNLCKTMSKPEMIKTTILKGVAESKHDKILNGDSEYCLNKPLGFDNWVKLLGMESEKLYKVDWLTDLFGLTMREIDSIFGKEEYLYSDCIDFNRKLSTNYNCKDPNACGNEIIYRQLINGKVINDIDKGMKNLTDLYKQININYYPFEKSPELFNFFGQYKEKHKEAEDYNDYELEIEQLERLIDEKSSLSLLSTNNSFFFLSKIDSNNLGVLAERYGMDENTVSFINEYIFEFLPELLLYPSFKNGEETLKVDQMAKAYSNMASDMIKKTYYQLNKLDHLFNRLYAIYVWEELNKELNVEVMQYEEEDICFLIMQQILDDGRKALKICGDPVTSFKSIPDTMKWIDPYRCVVFNETQCNMTVIDRLKEIVYVTENEIKSIYTEHSFGSILENSYKNLYNSLNCRESDKCFDDKYLLKMDTKYEYLIKINKSIFSFLEKDINENYEKYKKWKNDRINRKIKYIFSENSSLELKKSAKSHITFQLNEFKDKSNNDKDNLKLTKFKSTNNNYQKYAKNKDEIDLSLSNKNNIINSKLGVFKNKSENLGVKKKLSSFKSQSEENEEKNSEYKNMMKKIKKSEDEINKKRRKMYADKISQQQDNEFEQEIKKENNYRMIYPILFVIIPLMYSFFRYYWND